jgi:hypothetical protein
MSGLIFKLYPLVSTSVSLMSLLRSLVLDLDLGLDLDLDLELFWLMSAIWILPLPRVARTLPNLPAV